jgi:hypothetical protein
LAGATSTRVEVDEEETENSPSLIEIGFDDGNADGNAVNAVKTRGGAKVCT